MPLKDIRRMDQKSPGEMGSKDLPEVRQVKLPSSLEGVCMGPMDPICAYEAVEMGCG